MMNDECRTKNAVRARSAGGRGDWRGEMTRTMNDVRKLLLPFIIHRSAFIILLRRFRRDPAADERAGGIAHRPRRSAPIAPASRNEDLRPRHGVEREGHVKLRLARLTLIRPER